MLDAPCKSLRTHKTTKPLCSFIQFFVISEKQSRFFEYFNFLCSEIQYLAVLIWIQSTLLITDDHNLASLFLHKLCRSVAFKDTLEQNLSISFLSALSVIIWCYLSIIFLTIVYLAFMAFTGRDIAKSLQKGVGYLFQLHFGIIFWYVNVILLATISLQKKGKTLPILADIADQEQVFYLIQYLLLASNYVFGIITSWLCFDPFRSNSLFAIQTPYFQFLTFFFKAIMVPFAANSSRRLVTQALFVVFSIIISTSRLVHLFRNFPFYNHKPMKIAVISTTIAMFFSLDNIIASIWYKNNLVSSLSPLYLVIFLLPVALKLSLNRFESLIKFYLTINTSNLKTAREINGKLFVLQYLSEKVKLSLNENIKMDQNELYFLRDLSHHSATCENKECLCSTSNKSQNGQILDIINQAKSLLFPYFNALSYNVLVGGIENIKQSAELKVSLAQLIVANSTDKLNSALIYLFGATDQDLGVLKIVEKQILVKKIQSKVLAELKHSSDEKINIAHFVDYQTDATCFLSQIISITTQYLNFWEGYKKSKLKMADVVQKSNDIEKSASLIDKLWYSNVAKYEAFYHLMKESYGLYLSLVRNSPYSSKESIQKFKWKKKLQGLNPACSVITNSDLATSKVLSFQVSMMRERIGKVISVSENIHGSLGFTAQEVIGKNINCLMPATYAEKHDQILLNYLDKTKYSEAKDIGTVTVYIKTKAGPILPCSVYITLFPYIQKELAYIGIVKVLKVNYDSIIVNKNGYIDSFTKNIGRKLNLLIGKKTHLRDICGDFEKIESYFEVKSSKFTPNSKYKDTHAFDFSLNLDGTIPTIPNQTSRKRMKKDDPANFQSTNISLIFTKHNIQAGYSKYSVQLIKKVLEGKEFYILEMEYSGEAEMAPTSSKRVALNEDITKHSDDDFDQDVPTERPFIEKTMVDGYETLRTREGKSYQLTMSTRIMEGKSDYMDLDTTPEKRRISYFGTPHQHVSRAIEKESVDSANESVEKEVVKLGKQVSGLTPERRNNKLLHIESERASAASTVNNIDKKLEKAIYTLPKDKTMVVLKIQSLAFIAICILLLVIFRLETKEKLELVKGNVSVITTSNLRLFEISEVNRRARVVSLFRDGLVEDRRYIGFGIRTIFPTAFIILDGIQKNLNIYNSEVRIALEKIEPHLQRELLGNVIPIYDPDDQFTLKYATIFEAATMIVIKTKKLLKTSPTLITNNNTELNFLLNNTLNEQLLVSEQVTNVVLSDNDYKLDFLTSLTLKFMAVWFVIGGVLMAVFCYNQFRSVQSRTKFIGLFLHLTNEEIDPALHPVKSFRNNLIKNGFDFKASQIEEPLNKSSNPASSVRRLAKGSRYVKKDVSMKRINYRVILAFILVFSFLLLLLIPFIYTNIIVTDKNTAIKTHVNTIVKVNSILYDMNLLSSAVYEYIQYNGTTKVRTRDIGPELEAAFTRLSGSQAFFSDLLEVKSGSTVVIDPEFEQLLTGNLCKYLNITQALCTLVKGALDRGMIGMNSYVLLALRRVKDMFDYSDKSFASAKKALSLDSLIYIELIYFMMQLPAYQRLGQILQARIDTHIQSVDEVLKVLMIISIVLYAVFGVIISVCLWRVIEEENVKWKKVFRKIPFKVIISNKAFTSYLVRESDHALGAIKK